MKSIVTLLFLLLGHQISFAQYRYVYPVAGSSFHPPQVTIILRNGEDIDPTSFSHPDLVQIVGSKSGSHDWTARLSDDRKTVIVKPIPVFEYGEQVSVSIKSLVKKQSGEAISGTSMSFSIRDAITAEQQKAYSESDLQVFRESFGFDEKEGPVYPLDSMPSFTINVNNNPAPGQIFYCNQQEFDEDDTNSFPTIIQNDGTILFARDLGKDGHDFKINRNGYLTYYKYKGAIWMIMDSNYNVIDSIQCKNGYELETNGHDLQMYPDGHSFLIAYNNQTVDMTAYGGFSNATVKGLIVQELDVNRDVVFEWRSWDHFQITDATVNTDLTDKKVDYVHGNTVERDFDGNIMISCRNMCELTKINRETGDIIWRMNGENNQFTFVNDNIPGHFSQQHDLRRLDNGHISLFNNGNFLPVEISSAKEYALDEVNKIATLVWYYEHPDVEGEHVFGRASANAQQLSNGNWMIDWGNIFWNRGLPSMTEVDSNKNIVWEMTFDEAGQKSYRVHKFEWNPCSRITGYTMAVTFNGSNRTTLSWQPANGAKYYQVDYRLLGAATWSSKSSAKPKVVLNNLLAGGSYEWHVKTNCAGNPPKSSGYSVIDTFTRPLKMVATNNAEEGIVNVYPVPATDQLTIQFKDVPNASVFIRNELGATVYNNPHQGQSEGIIHVDVSSWPAGIYMLEVTDGTAYWRAEKIIIQ